MELRVMSWPDDLTYLALDGRLDLQGTVGVELQFTSLTAAQRRPAVIDLAQVVFMGSIGIRMFVSVAKTLARHGHRIVLLNPRDNVRKVLEFAGMAQILFIADSETEAFRIARGGSE